MTFAAFIALVLAIVGLILIVIAVFKQLRTDAIRATPTVAIASLSQVPPGDVPACKITGVAEAGPAGPVVGPMSGRPCVWFHTKVVEHWTTTHTSVSPGPNGTSTTTTHTNHHQRVLEENGSPPQIYLRDGSGAALLDFGPAKVDRPFPSFRNRVPARAVPGLRRGRQNHYVTFSEDILGAGQPIFALGRGGPHPWTGVPALVKPDSGRFIVSTRSEAQFIEGTRTAMIILYVIGGMLAAGGAVFLAVSLFA